MTAPTYARSVAPTTRRGAPHAEHDTQPQAPCSCGRGSGGPGELRRADRAGEDTAPLHGAGLVTVDVERRWLSVARRDGRARRELVDRPYRLWRADRPRHYHRTPVTHNFQVAR